MLFTSAYDSLVSLYSLSRLGSVPQVGADKCNTAFSRQCILGIDTRTAKQVDWSYLNVLLNGSIAYCLTDKQRRGDMSVPTVFPMVIYFI